jgi:hypothetical protein
VARHLQPVRAPEAHDEGELGRHRRRAEALAVTEDRIAAAQRFFNGNVRDLRNLRDSFPSSIVGGMMNIEEPTFFELDDANERVVPRVDVSGSR